MDAAHRAALLVASCLHTPVNARTRAPAALYERQQGPVAAEEQDGFDLYPEPEKEQNSSLNTDCEDWIDFPKMCRSNQEYYLKLEELKKAHLETMAKLEIMYRHKLHVKGVHPLGNTDAVPSICHRMHEKQRMQEYLQAMEEMEERVNQRPLLLERVTQKNARIAAEKHYSDILKELRLCEDFISKKGQTPKLLYPSSDEDFKRYTEDRESLNEDKIQERESCKEEEPSPQSDQSCEEEAGMRHQSDQSCEEEEEKASCQSHQFCDGEEEASHQSHQSEEEEQVEVASTLSDHDALKYKDEKYEECGSEEKPSDNEAD